MKEIPLTQGKVAIVDDEDYLELLKFKWYAAKKKNIHYAIRKSPCDPLTHERIIIHMHSIIVGTPPGMETDHINGNGLDNRRCNLRIVTKRQNQQNQHTPKSSKYPGVSLHKLTRKWRAQINVNGHHHHLGLYNDEETAARRYQIACDWQVIDL